MQKYNTKQKKRFRSSLVNVNHTTERYQSDVCIVFAEELTPW